MLQSQALSILKTGANVFLTGEPGAGKSHTINQYVKYLRERGIEPAITASTGIAATHIQGMTIHSWSGIGIRRYITPYDLDHIATTEYLAKRIRNTKVLIIDEISMIDANTLDMVDAVCRAIIQSPEPFGGIQVVLVGDFFQLPPVSQDNEASFAFNSKVWKQMVPLVCYLTEQHRQNDDNYLSVLSAIRTNTYDIEHHEHLERRVLEDHEEINNLKNVTRLFAKNVSVDEINNIELKKIGGESLKYRMQTKGGASMVASLVKGCLSPETLELKVGAVVMCTKNNPSRGYVNGTLAEVIDFAGGTNYPIIKTRDGVRITMEPMDWVVEDQGKVKASISQIPLRLAWAITIHKSQGMSLDAAVMDLREVFEYGQGYVALSRVRSLNGLYLLGFNQKTFLVHPHILEEDNTFRSKSRSTAVAFENIPHDELQKMHNNFLSAIGGSIEAKSLKKGKVEKADTLETTRAFILKQANVNEIAKARKMTTATILLHVEKLVAQKRLEAHDVYYLLDEKTAQDLDKIKNIFLKLQTDMLTPVFEKMKGEYSYDQLRIVRILSKVE